MNNNSDAFVSPRSAATIALEMQSSTGPFVLQKCRACSTYLYPARDACPHCWSCEIQIERAPNTGEVVGFTTLHHSNSAFFKALLPWRVGLIKLDCGPTAMVHLHHGSSPGDKVDVEWVTDKAGNIVMVAIPKGANLSVVDFNDFFVRKS